MPDRNRAELAEGIRAAFTEAISGSPVPRIGVKALAKRLGVSWYLMNRLGLNAEVTAFNRAFANRHAVEAHELASFLATRDRLKSDGVPT